MLNFYDDDDEWFNDDEWDFTDDEKEELRADVEG